MIGILVDYISAPMILITALISCLVHIYSIGYMADDKQQKKYFGTLGLFTFSMLGLVMSNNMLVTFCFWELIGFSSYVLIGHWSEKKEAGAAATKASLMNRVGDIAFLIFLMIVWTNLGSMESISLQDLSSNANLSASICLLVAVMAKSAQFPLFSWLPNAMEGPTPVSALLHSATMVAAGVFLLIRFSLNFYSPQFVMIVSCIGGITAVLGGVAALFQYDIKKILAYSTISQLGLMVISSYAGYSHLINHAFFKAGLFLGAGAIIHALHQAHETKDVNDIRNMGNLRKQMPYTFVCFIICAASLSGLPFTSGFTSKELILSHPINWIATVSAWCITFLTPLYTFRLVWFAFFGKPKSTESQAHGVTVIEFESTKIQEVPWIMRLPMLVLAFGSLSILVSWNSLSFISVSNFLLSFTETPTLSISLFSMLVISGAILLGYILYHNKPTQSYPDFLTNNFFIDKLYQVGIIKSSLVLAQASQTIDRQWIDKTLHRIVYAQIAFSHLVSWGDRVIIDGLVTLVAKAGKSMGSILRSFTSGKIQSYITWAMLALIIFIIYMIFHLPQ
jgi:NADH-quinone oxidoreductase subunit L